VLVQDERETLDTIVSMFPVADWIWLEQIFRSCGKEFSMTVDIVSEMLPKQEDDDTAAETQQDEQMDGIFRQAPQRPPHEFTDSERRQLDHLKILHNVDISIVEDVFVESG